MADLARPAATRAAERKCDMASIGHQAEAVHALAPAIEISVITAIRIAVERPFGEQVQLKRPEPLDMLNVLVEVFGRERRRCAETAAARRPDGTRTHPLLLPAPPHHPAP